MSNRPANKKPKNPVDLRTRREHQAAVQKQLQKTVADITKTRLRFPKQHPTPEAIYPVELSVHAATRYLERVCHATPEEVEAVRLVTGGMLRTMLLPVVIPPELHEGVFSRFGNAPEERVVCVPPTHTAIVKQFTVVTVMGWGGAEPYVPDCLLPYLDHDRQRRLPLKRPPLFHVHSPLGTHRSVRISAAHRCGTACVAGIGVEVIAEAVGMQRHLMRKAAAIARVAASFRLQTWQVQDALDYMALPPHTRARWSAIGNRDVAQYWAAKAAGKVTQ